MGGCFYDETPSQREASEIVLNGPYELVPDTSEEEPSTASWEAVSRVYRHRDRILASVPSSSSFDSTSIDQALRCALTNLLSQEEDISATLEATGDGMVEGEQDGEVTVEDGETREPKREIHNAEDQNLAQSPNHSLLIKPPLGTDLALRYIRDRINVPRDMSLHAARRLRAALEATAASVGNDRPPPPPVQHRRDQDPAQFKRRSPVYILSHSSMV